MGTHTDISACTWLHELEACIAECSPNLEARQDSSTSSRCHKRQLCDRDGDIILEPNKSRRREANRSGQSRRRQALADKIDELGRILGNAPMLYTGKADRMSVLQTSAKLLWAQYCPPRDFIPAPLELSASEFPNDRERLNSKWNEAEVGLFIATTTLQSVDCNSMLLKQLGYQPFEVKNSWDLMSPETATYALKEIGSLITGQKEKIYTQGQIRHKSGEYKWWHGCMRTVALKGTTLIFGWMQVTANVSQEDSPLSKPFAHYLEEEAPALTHVRMQFQGDRRSQLAA